MSEKITILKLQENKEKRYKMTMTCAYDSISGLIAEKAGIDLVLIGDSVGMVLLGKESTVSITMEEIIYHTKAAISTCKTPLIVSDMPFMSFQSSEYDAVKNAGRLLKEGGADAVKIEGGKEFARTAKAIVEIGIPCMGHIGLTPQTISQMGGYRVQGKTIDSAKKIMEDALALEEVGCFAILLECIPSQLSKLITNKCKIPIFGIGAGADVDGQSLVMHDIVGLTIGKRPKFVKEYLNGLELMVNAMEKWVKECKENKYPTSEHCYTVKDDVLDCLY